MDIVLEKMIKKSDECIMRDKYVAALVDKKMNIMMMSTNQPYPQTMGAHSDSRLGKHSYHAEERCLRSAHKKYGKKLLEKCTLLIIKTGGNKELRTCSPCKNCSKIIASYRINCWTLLN